VSNKTPIADPSNGYEAIAPEFRRWREQSNIGVATILSWVRSLPRDGAVLDLGCGAGLPLSKVVAGEGLTVYGVDASASLASAFRRHLPAANIACERVEDSGFFGRTFDGVMAIGLIFLLPADTQRSLIRKVAAALKPDGRFLFTSPMQACDWTDVLTGRKSCSLGAGTYRALCMEAGLSMMGEVEDEGSNHYYDTCLPGRAADAA
jgi:2-polyprenyl-3-methyl-5-hydroxy-6-metoxy-1,4-benzoquinol methylase